MNTVLSRAERVLTDHRKVEIPGYPNLGEGLRFDGHAYDYHSLAIHKDDVEEFVRRVKEYKKSRSFE